MCPPPIQYRPFLNDFNQKRGTQLTAVVPVHIEPFVAYSKKLTSIGELKDGATVAIPNDPVNGGRGILLLAKLNLLTSSPPSRLWLAALKRGKEGDSYCG